MNSVSRSSFLEGPWGNLDVAPKPETQERRAYDEVPGATTTTEGDRRRALNWATRLTASLRRGVLGHYRQQG